MKDDLMSHRCGSDHVKYVGDAPVSGDVSLECDKCSKNWTVNVWSRLSVKLREFIWQRCAAFRAKTMPKELRKYYASCVKKGKRG